MHKHHDPGTKLYEEVQARQRNTTWPDAMVNSKSVDELIFKGSPKATKVQRIGIAVVGIFYLIISVGLMMQASEQHSKLEGVLAALMLLLGTKVAFNAFKSAEPKPKNRHPHRIASGTDDQ